MLQIATLASLISCDVSPHRDDLQVVGLVGSAQHHRQRLGGQRHCGHLAGDLLRGQLGTYTGPPRQGPGRHRSAGVRVNLCLFAAADVDPAVLQRLLLVDLLLRRGRVPGGENLCRNQVGVCHSSLSPPHT